MTPDDVAAHLGPSGSGAGPWCVIREGVELLVEALAAPREGRWLAIWADLAPAEAVRARSALVATGELAAGALAVREGRVGLRLTHPLAALDRAGLDHLLGWVAARAIELRAARGAVAAEERFDLFTHPLAFVYW